MSLNIVMIFQSMRLVICIHPSSAPQAIPHEAFTKNGIVHPNRSIASLLTDGLCLDSERVGQGSLFRYGVR